MSYLFTVCGRAGSKGVKNKNLKDFCGAPLVYYSLAAIALFKERYAENEDVDVVLNTDSEELIALVGRQDEIKVGIIRRDESLGGDSVPKVDVIKDCLSKATDMFGKEYDMVIDLDITSPLRTAEDVANAVAKKRDREETDVVYSVTNSRRNPYFNMVKEENGFFVKAVASDYTARQQAPVMYDMNASIYAYSVRALKEKSAVGFFNNGCDAVFMRDTAVLDIDSEEDYALMQVIGAHFFETQEDMGEVRNKAISMVK